MGKISDIWVRLGLKKEGFDKGMDDAAKKAEGFGGSFKKIKATALAAWAAIGASVTAFIKEFVNHSQTMGDKWAQATGQMKTVWSQFLTSLTNWDWEGFGQRVRDAMDATSQSISAHDAEFEVLNSIKMRKAAMAEELAQLQIIMRDTRKSYDERVKAAQDYLDKVAPLYQAEIDLRKRIYQTDTAEYLQKAGVDATADNVDLLRKFFTDIAPNEKLMRQLVEYQKKNLGKSYELSKSDLADIDKFYEQYGMRAAATLTTIASYYQSTNDEVANKVIDAIVAYDKSLAAMNEETRRIQTVKNTALAQMQQPDIQVEMPPVDAEVEQVAGEIEKEINAQIEEAIAGVETETFEADIKVDVNPAVTGAELSFAEFELPRIDTTDLAEGMREVELIISSYQQLLDSVNADSFNPTVDTTALEAAMAKAQAVYAEYQRQMALTQEMNYMLEDSIVASMSNGLQALMDVAAGVEGADMKGALAAFIAPLGDTMKQMGAMIMAEGLAMEAFKKSFTNPMAAIAAGAALMAVGAAVSAGLQKMTANPTGGGTSSYSGAGSYGSSEMMNYEQTLTVEVVGKISGSDIVLAGSKTQNKWNR